MAIRIVRADELRQGDILSNNGATIESAVLCQGGGVPDEVCVCYSFEPTEEFPYSQKFEYVSPDKEVPLWIEDENRG